MSVDRDGACPRCDLEYGHDEPCNRPVGEVPPEALRERVAAALWECDREDDRRTRRSIFLPPWSEAVREADDWPEGSVAANVQRYRTQATLVRAALTSTWPHGTQHHEAARTPAGPDARERAAGMDRDEETDR